MTSHRATSASAGSAGASSIRRLTKAVLVDVVVATDRRGVGRDFRTDDSYSLMRRR